MTSHQFSVKVDTNIEKCKDNLINSLTQSKNIKGLRCGISQGRLATTKNETSSIMKAILNIPEDSITIDKRMARSKSNYKVIKGCLNNQNVATINTRGMNSYQPTHNRSINKSYIDTREQRNNLNFLYMNPNDSTPKKEFMATYFNCKEEVTKVNKSFQLPIPIKVLSQSKKSTKLTTKDSLNNVVEENIEELHMNLVAQYQKIQRLLRKLEPNDTDLVDSNKTSKDES